MDPVNQFQAVLELPGAFIALSSDQGRFQGLIERTVVLEQVVQQIVQKTSS